MPAVHENSPCHVCEKTHFLYLAHVTVPDLQEQLYYICPTNGFAGDLSRQPGTDGFRLFG